jgi:hypothetical protein
MRKALLLLATMLPLLVAAQGWPASYGGVVLVVDNDNQLNDVKTNLSTYSNWFDLIFLGKDCSTMSSTDVQAFKAVNVGIVGYMETLNQATAKSMLDAGYVGYRYRTSGASKANAENTRDINAALNATFVVGDMYGNSTDTNVLKQWLKFNYKDGNYQAAVCDNSLKLSKFEHSVYHFAEVNDQGLLADFIAKRYAINYVPTELPGEEARRAAYAFIFTMPGTPIVFKADWDNTTDYQTLIQYLIRARHAAGITNQAAIYGGNEGGPEFGNNGNTNGVSWRVMGNKGAMYLQLGWKYVRDGSVPSGFTQVYKAHNNEEFRVSISNGVALTNYNAMASDNSKIRGGDSDPLGYPIIDKNSGHYNGTLNVTIKPNNNFTTLVFTTDGNNPTAQSEKIRGERTIKLTKTTTLKVAVLESDGKTVKINSMVARQYVIDTKAVSDVTIYAKRGDQSTAAPYIYVDGVTSSDVQMTNKRSIGGIEWFYYTISGSGTKRFILKESSNGKQTPWLTADRDAFYAFCDHPQATYNSGVACYAFDETNTYMVDYYDPKVSIDKASGDYKNWVQPTVSATYKDATIVYTTDDTEPTPDNGTKVIGPTKIINDVFKYAGEDKSVTLRAGVLYNGEVINLVARTYHIKAPEAQYPGASTDIPTTGINIFVKRADGSSPIYAHVWGGASRNLEKSDALNVTKNVKGETWYYLHYDTNDNPINVIFATSNSWAHQTEDITNLGTGNHFFVYNQAATSKETPSDQAGTYSQWVNNVGYDNNYVDQGNLIPSCATYVPSKQFFYFENNKPYVSPHAWIFNGYTPISSDCWPGSAFIEPIGTSPEGYAIYRWTWDEGSGDLTAQMNFNDQGGNVVGTSQTNSYNFENAEYYKVEGGVGKVSASYVTLAEAIRYATETQPYYITDDLYVGHISKDGQYIYAKDARGSALNPFYPSAGFTLDEDKDDDAYAYDQSNWVEIKLPAGKWITNRNSYIGKTIAGGTLYGTFRSRNNPQIEIATGGMLPVFNTGGYNVTLEPFNNTIALKAFRYNSFRDDSDNGVGDLNLYHTGHFLTSVGDIDNTDDRPIINGNRFYVNPKILEVAAIRWAVYKDGKFYAPSKNNSAAGCIEIVNDPSSDSDSWWEGSITLQNDKVYLLKGIVINKGANYLFHKDDDDYHHNAPRRVGIVPATPGDRYSIRLIDAYTDDTITGVNDVNINKTIESVRYINLMGAESSRAFDGVNIVVTKYTDGTTSTTKVVF